MGVQRQVEVFDDHLDLIAVQESLCVLWENAVGGLPVEMPKRGSVEAVQLAEEIVDAVATRLVDYPAFRQHYIELVQRLLFQGSYLGAEDLVDLLTLKDTPQTQMEDFATAIKVLVRAEKDLAAERFQAALRAVWRRAVIRDDWLALGETTNVSDQVFMHDLQQTGLWVVLKEVSDATDEIEARRVWCDVAELAHEQTERLTDVLEARFVDAPHHSVSLLLEDACKEVETVRSFWDDSDLPRLAHELAGLAAGEREGRHGLAPDDSMLDE